MVSGGFFSLPTQPGAYVTYDAASNVYTLKGVPATRNGTAGQGQVPDTALTPGSPDPTETRYELHTQGVKLYVDTLDYVTHTGGSGYAYSYAAIAAHTYAYNYTGVSGFTTEEHGLITFGFPTNSGEVPTSGKRTYVLEGFQLASNDLGVGSRGWTITLTVDFASGTYVLAGKKAITTEDPNSTFVDTGNISASGSFTRGNAITGTVHIDVKRDATFRPGYTNLTSDSQSQSLDGRFAAAFFGPSAEEIGIAFTANGTSTTILTGPAITNPSTTGQASTWGGFLGHS
jgi:hypothetical protein